MKIKFIPCNPEDLEVGDLITYTEDGDSIFYLHIKEIVENKHGRCIVESGCWDKYVENMCGLKRATLVIDEKELEQITSDIFTKQCDNIDTYFGDVVEVIYDNEFTDAVKEIINKLLGA